jgi:hypothetical protein
MSERRPRRRKGAPKPPSTPPDYRAEGFTPTDRPPWQRPGLLLPLALVALIVCVAAAALLTFYGSQGAQQPDNEEPAARASAEPLPGGTPISDIGSGGELDGGWYRLYFTAPKYPDNPANHRGGLDEKLVALIDTATTSVDVAAYDFDLANVADAMVRARGRGATVRMVTDTDT